MNPLLSNSSDFLVASMLILFAIGISMIFFSLLISLTTALGEKQWVWGILMLLVGPIAAIPHSLLYWPKTKYAGKLSLIGLLFIAPPIAGFFWLKKTVVAPS